MPVQNAPAPTPATPARPPAVARVSPSPEPMRPESTSEAILRATRPPPPAPRLPSNRGRVVTVMIDPGHGGEDPGAIGPTGLREKDVVLAIGRMLKERLDATPGVRALMTRDRDFFVPLNTRVL